MSRSSTQIDRGSGGEETVSSEHDSNPDGGGRERNVIGGNLSELSGRWVGESEEGESESGTPFHKVIRS